MQGERNLERKPIVGSDEPHWLPICCRPANAAVAQWWGACLLFGGGIWLFSNLGILTLVLNLIWPALLIAFGVYYLRWAAAQRVESDEQEIAHHREERR